MKTRSTLLLLGLALLLLAGVMLFPAHTVLADSDGHSGPPFELLGAIQQLPSTPGYIGAWKVNNLTINVTTTTEIEPNLAAVQVGAMARIEGRLQADGSINASNIEILPKLSEVEFFGVIQSLPANAQNGDWTVNKLTVHVTSTTQINPNVQAAVVGAYVKVKGAPQPDGSVNASKIDVLAGGTDDHHVKFVGVVQSLPPSGLVGDWTMSAPMNMNGASSAAPSSAAMVTQTITVHVAAGTSIDQARGQVAVGVLVQVEGVLQPDKSVNAGEIEVVFAPPSAGQTVEFLGRIQTLPTGSLIGDWTVNDRTVHVTTTTAIDQSHAQAAVGAFVRVKGTIQADKSVNATEIEVRAAPPPPPTRYIKFYGVVQDVPSSGTTGTYKINGLTVNVTAATEIEHGPIVKGSLVEVKGILQTDGTVNALKIEVKGTAGANSPFGRTSAIGQVGK